MIVSVTCEDLMPFFRVLQYIFNIVKWSIPIVLITMITIDLIKVITGNEKDFSDIKSKTFKRVLYAIAIFLVPTIVSLIFRSIGEKVSTGELTSPTEWISCYSKTISKNNDSIIYPRMVSCDEVNVVIELGKTVSLNCSVSPKNATNKSLKYQANNDNVLVNGKNVFGNKIGVSTINVSSYNGKTFTINATVINSEIVANSFSVSNKNINLEIGDQEEIKHIFIPNNITDRNVMYSSYDKDIIVINNNVITALKEGSTTIVATTSNGLQDTILVTIKKKDVCESDSVSPNILVDGDYVYTKFNENIPPINDVISMKVMVSDNCQIEKISYCVSDLGDNNCHDEKVINNNETISINGNGNKKIIISAIDKKGNKTINEYYVKFKKENDEEVIESNKFICYLGYKCSKGYYHINYDEYLGSCYEDKYFLFIKTGKKLIGNPYPKFYNNLEKLNNEVKSFKAGLVGGWDDATNAYRFLYKCDVDCDEATVNNCVSYAYYDPSNNTTVENSEVVDNWSYFDYLENSH